MNTLFDLVLKPTLTFVADPKILLPLASVALILVLKYYRVVTQPKIAAPIGLALAALLVVSCFDPNFKKNILKPDNVPIVLLLFTLFFFLWLSLRRAAINDAAAERGEPPLEARMKRETVLVWPDLVMIELICLVLVSAALIFWAVFVRAPLEEPASAALTPNPSKAPWYFLGLQEMLVYFDPWYAGVLLPTLIIVGLMAIPYVDTNPKGSGYYTLSERKFAITVYLFGFIVFWVVLITIGTFLRGPNWNLFGPYDVWDPHKSVPLKNINVSEIFWVKMLKQGMPAQWYVRELPGLMIVGVFALLGPLVLAKTLLKDLFKKLDIVRFSVVAVLLLFMLSMPLKMMGRWMINLKYIIYIPEYFINI
ncbi:MAG TPA: cytochrome C [Planctomycetota bacterium]|nr:cytochrome C [Planctomycetota bacterium]